MLSKFPIEKTIDLLHKGAAMFTSNPNKMGEWINFLQSSFASLLYEGALLIKDMNSLETLNSFVISKIRTAKIKILANEEENDNLTVKFNTEIKVKEYLVKRLHDLDTNYSERMDEFYEMKNVAQQLEAYNYELEERVKQDENNFEGKRIVLAEEIFELRKQLETVELQKQELLKTLEDFKIIFNELTL